jgi:biotin-[acetyl-CoA-carboxylase] ligase BirA-like protein
MKTIADKKETLFNFFGSENVISSINPKFAFQIKTFTKSLFKNKKIELYENDISSFWEYLFITSHSSESQFDVINNLLSKNVDLPDKLVCLAEMGDGFHGFRKRSWSAEKGNIHLTVYFKPQKKFEFFHAGLLIVAAVSVLKTIDAIPDLKDMAKTKWVNDIIIQNSKVCGIITQSFSTGNKISGAVIGIGLNVLSEPKFKKDNFTPSATSLINHSKNEKCNLQFVLKNLLVNLSNSIELLNNGEYETLLKIYSDRSAVIGKNVGIYSDPIDGESELITTGKVTGINQNLELILDGYNAPIKSGRLEILD